MRFVVRQAQVVLRRQQRILGFLQMRDSLVDLLDGGLELAAREVVVTPELRLEVLHLLLEVRDVDVLVAYLGELGLVRKRRKRGIA